MAYEFPVAVWQSFCKLLYTYFTFTLLLHVTVMSLQIFTLSIDRLKCDSASRACVSRL